MPISSLAKKLYIRPGYTVALVNAPEGALDLIAPLPDDVKVVTSTKGKPDLILYFVKSIAELEKAAKDLKKSLGEETILWFAYPKVSSKVATDLTRDRGWKQIYEMGLIGIASIAIDSTWSGLRFRTAVDRTEDELITKQYDDSRAAWRPLYDQLATLARNLGPDVELIPRQTYVAFSRGKQFALVKPSRDHLDLVLKLSSPALSSRLQPALGMGSGSMTHRVALTKAEDIDRQVITWLQDAYRAVNK
jgi:hypothetical protein